jgi:hypothetical protein
MSQGPWSSDGGEVPMHPLDELWYLQDEGEVEAQGPFKGRVLKEMIQAGSIGAASLVAKVGATQWTAIADVPAFADHLLARGRVPLKYAGFWISNTSNRRHTQSLSQTRQTHRRSRAACPPQTAWRTSRRAEGFHPPGGPPRSRAIPS